MTTIHVLPKRFEDFLRHLGCNPPEVCGGKKNDIMVGDEGLEPPTLTV